MADLELIVQPLAELDLDNIWFSIAQNNIKIADSFVDKIKQKFNILISFPESGPKREDIWPNARILIEGSYIVIYVFKNDQISILRVIHGARDLSEIDFS